jgi:hypothetical protein
LASMARTVTSSGSGVASRRRSTELLNAVRAVSQLGF